MDWLLRFADPTIEWDYALITLTVRFVGVFVVMFVMQVALQASARLVQRIERRRKALVAATLAAPTPFDEEAEPDGATAAAIGLALALEGRRPAPGVAASGSSSWAIAGRMQRLHRQPRG